MERMSDEEFERIYGRPPRRVVRRKKVYWNRIIAVAVVLLLIILLIVKLASGNSNDSGNTPVVVNKTTSQTDSSQAKKDSVSEEAQLTVCIDPGHGDYDSGTTSLDGTRLEKDDNLAISLLIEKYLEEQNVNVVMTRSTDVFVELEQRSVMANESGSDLFICMHRNSYSEAMSGVEVWVNNAEPPEDTALAQNILDGLKEVGISNDRGVNYGYIGDSSLNYSVNNHTLMPSCLVELGFVTDDTDNEMFDKYIDAYAKSIADSIIKTAKELKIIDEDGNRLVDGPYITTDKVLSNDGLIKGMSINGMVGVDSGTDSETESTDNSINVTETNPTQTAGVVYNTQEQEY